MNDAESPPGVGRVVRIVQGRETGNYAVVIGIVNERFLLLADGEKRKFDRAKKKNISHVEVTSHVSNEVKRSIEETGRVTNAKLRFALSSAQEQPQLLKEGE
ncbi:KOW domain-containing RNA-binding protein [Salibacterium halotolerans]|uniref:Ribosomal protein L14E/L6E/L27E n=1 Tax=Salibacterium halotolerans TaxID=1884432 RepID=A0A1I5WG57_9BACI|nr:KOW domain-containing RNA-binding protein [Salibacterium halotolerans]SFQ18675.1 Ribosomal protein L14E/L6E/L27E [Salibacterium halotolerans]